MLRKDGSVWCNLGDSYATSGSGQNNSEKSDGNPCEGVRDAKYLNQQNPRTAVSGLKPKDLCGIPWRVALALQADGWWLRSAMPWVKRAAMPESVTDRPASALEYVFLLTKSQKYYFDMESIKPKQVEYERERRLKEKAKGLNSIYEIAAEGKTGQSPQSISGAIKSVKRRHELAEQGSRNFRNTDLFYQSIEPPHGMIFCGDEMVGLDVNPKAMKESHFATFPPKLIEPCILAGTSEKGCCAECGSPWGRVVEKKRGNIPQYNRKTEGQPHNPSSKMTLREQRGDSKTTGWKPPCGCNANPIPCTILDPFGGSMTTAIVAYKHNRKFIMIELSETYIKDIGIPRIEKETRQLKLFN